MFVFSFKIKINMALHSHKSAGIIQGWVRALLLLLVYTAVSSVLAIFIQSLALWLIGTSLAAILLVYLFRLLIDRRRFIDIGLARAGFYPDAWIGLIAA